MYIIKNFDGVNDEHLQKVADHGRIVEAAGGNWDLLEYNGYIYYMAHANTGCSSGAWGTLEYWNKYSREKLQQAIKNYRAQIRH